MVGLMRMSDFVSVSNCRVASRRIRMDNIWLEMAVALPSLSRANSGCTDVDDNQHIHIHGTGNIDGQIVGDAAIHQHLPFALNRHEQPRH